MTFNPKVVATINVGVTPAALAVMPNNSIAYVANLNEYGTPGGDTISVVDLKINRVIKTITHPSFNQPYTITLNPQASKAYITNSNSSTISILDTETNMVEHVIQGFDGPCSLAITPDGRKAYVSHYGGPDGLKSGSGQSVRVVDLYARTIIKEISVGLAPNAVAITPDGHYCYVLEYRSGKPGSGVISIIDVVTDTLTDKQIFGFSGPFAIAMPAVQSQHKYAYITNFGSNDFAPFGKTVSVIDIANHTLVKNIELGIQPSGIAMSSDDQYVYATNYNSLYAGPGFTALTAGEGTVDIIDTVTQEVVGPSIVVGKSPSAIAVSSNHKFAYVTNYTSNTLSVISLQP